MSEEIVLDGDDSHVDFSAAGLYLVGLQTVLSTVLCASVSVGCCWILPEAAISAVRTLVVTSSIGYASIQKPFRLGRVRGVVTMFNALRPCVVIYIVCLTLEQLVHTCVPTGEQVHAGWRRVLCHVMTSLMLLSGFVRAHSPQSETDLPFLLTAFSLLVIAVLPPPATALSGPLCEPIPIFAACERLLRAFLFSALYVVHVYSAAPNRNSWNELSLVVVRCSAASVWVLGAHLIVLVLAPVQAIVALWSRFGTSESGGTGSNLSAAYSAVDTRSDAGGSTAAFDDPESGSAGLYGSSHVLVSPSCLNGYTPYADQDTRIQLCGNKNSSSMTEACANSSDDSFQQVEPDVLSTIQAAQPLFSDSVRRIQTSGLGMHIGSPMSATHCSTVSSERMAELASRIIT
tara:strand:- start:5357 stop:6562 length:1206 start_codon:yes stop_codon:yes gene_type:complete